jgi:hypothetical protein
MEDSFTSISGPIKTFSDGDSTGMDAQPTCKMAATKIKEK